MPINTTVGSDSPVRYEYVGGDEKINNVTQISEIPANANGVYRLPSGEILSYVDGVSVGVGLTWLSPSGSDDSSPMIANYNANNGVLALGPGSFIVSSGIDLLGVKKWRNDANEYCGPVIVGSGISATHIYVTTPYQTNIRYQATSVTVGVNTLLGIPSHGLINGTLALCQFPNYRAPTTGNTIERLSGKFIYVKVIDANTVELCADAGLTAINSTSLGGSVPADLVNNPVYLRVYAGNTATNYRSTLRLSGPFVSGSFAPIMGTTISDLSIHAATTYPAFYNRIGIGVAIEANGIGVTQNTSPAQGNRFVNVNIDGFDSATLLDDCTNTTFENCNVQNNNNAVWKNYNVDIISWKSCRFGDDTIVVGQPLQEVSVRTPISYMPSDLVTKPPGSWSVETYESCWFMSVLGISLFKSTTASYSGALGSGTGASNIVIIRSCYTEQVRQLLDIQQSLVVDGLHIGNFLRDANLHVSQCVFGAHGGGGWKAQVSLKGITVDGTSAPKNGYVSLYDGVTTNEQYVPDIEFRGNHIYGTAIKNTLGHMVKITNGVNQSDILTGNGFYEFEGSLQTGGKKRTFKQALTTGTIKPYIFDQGLLHIIIGATGPITIANPGVNSAFTSDVFSTIYAAGLTSFYRLRMMPLEFIISQDATGGRTVTFDIDFVVNAGNESGALATNGQKAFYSFQWNGNKFIQISPAAVWV